MFNFSKFEAIHKSAMTNKLLSGPEYFTFFLNDPADKKRSNQVF